MEKIQAKNKREQSLIVNQVTIKPIARKATDIDRWRTALKAADSGKRQQLYALYEDLLLDNILSDAIGKRIEAITNAEITFTRNDKTEEVIDNLIDSAEFERLITEIMLSKFWGISVMELEFTDAGFIVHSLPRRHLRPQYGEIAVEENDERGIPYRDDFILEIGDPNDLGLILKSAPFVIYKRNGFGDWAQYTEVFGMPTQVFEYETFDEAARLELTKAAEESGGRPIVVIPKGSGFRVEPGAASGDGEVFDKLKKACNEEILIGINGQTLTTIQGDKGARSLGEVHMQVKDERHKSDRRFVQRVLNTLFVPMLEKRGFPVSDGLFSFPEKGESLGALDRMNLAERASRLAPIPQSHIYEITGIPQPEPGDELAEPAGVDFPEPGEPGEPDYPTEPGGRNLMERVFGFFAGAPATGAATGVNNTLTDEEGDDFNTRLAKRVARGEAKYFDNELFSRTAGDLLDAFHSGWRKAYRGVQNSIDYGAADEVVQTAMETNLYHFAAAKTLTEIQQLNQAYRASDSFSDYIERAQEITSVFNETWARTEYDTAGLVAESTSTYCRLQAQTDLFPYWEYRTVGDDKVRPEHAALNGLILPANDPRWKKIYPPNGWACRCYVVPRMRHEVEGLDLATMRQQADAYFDSREFKTAAVQGFGVNRAERREVFTANQQYIRKFPGKAAKYLNRLGATDYGLPTVTKRKAAATGDMPPYTGTAADWFAARQRDGVVTLTDRDGRKVALNARTYKSHTIGSHAGRVDYLQALPETLADPDEAWINAERGKSTYDNYTLIRYYRDEVLVVCCKIAGGKVNEVRTWFPLEMKARVVSSVRRGLLVFNKKAPV